MSRIGRLPVAIPAGVTVTLADGVLSARGPKGENSFPLPAKISVEIDEEKKELRFTRPDDSKTAKAFHGLTRALAANLVHGVAEGFEKKLEIVGVGFKLTQKGEGLELGLGFSHSVEVSPIEGVRLALDPENKMGIIVTGVDAQRVGEMAARIRALKKPEPYKGKGIRYAGERVRRKAGKTAGSK